MVCRRNSMKYSEQTLQNWTAPLSQTEEQRADNTIKMIRNAINSCDELKTMDIDIFIQGSYANNTNVRSESDVDVCVMLRDTFHTDYAQGKGREDYGFKASDFTFQEYRNLVKKALQDKFRTEYVYDGNKSLKLVCKAMLPVNMNEHYSCGVEAARCYFGNKVVSENDYVLIPNAIKISNFVFNDLTREKIRRENGLEGKHVIGHVGRFMAQKNHMFLLDVFAEVHNLDKKAQLVLLGDGELMEAVKQKAEKLNLEKNITFVGNVGNANEWYQAFDCFVLPSIWEGLPVVGVEAQAADLPCVFSANITREIGFSESAEFVGLDESLNKWAKTIEKALQQNDRVDRTNLITEKHYNIEIEAQRLQERYLQLYEERCQA